MRKTAILRTTVLVAGKNGYGKEELRDRLWGWINLRSSRWLTRLFTVIRLRVFLELLRQALCLPFSFLRRMEC